MWRDRIDPIVREITNFTTHIQQQAMDSNSWKSILDKRSIYGNKTYQVIFDKDYIANIREHSYQFSLSYELDHQQQYAALSLNRLLTHKIPTNLIVRPPEIAGEVGWKGEFGGLVNDGVNGIQERLNFMWFSGLLNALPKAPYVVEVGAGYGGLALSLKQFTPECHYIIIDLAESLKYSYSYLSLAGYTCRFVTSEEAIDLTDNSIDFWMIPAEFRQAVKGYQFDLAINTLSFTEMESHTVEGYGKFLAERLSNTGALFEQNQEYPNHRETPFLDSTKDLLQHYFDFRTDISQFSLHGIARVWTNALPLRNQLTNYDLDLAKIRQHKLALFGAGKLGIMVAQRLKPYGVVSHFYDNASYKWGNQFEGLMIKSPEDITADLEAQPNLRVILTSDKIHELYHQLEAVKDKVWFIQELVIQEK